MSAEAVCAACDSELEAGDLRCPVCATGRPEGTEAPPEAVATVLRCTDCNAVMRYDVQAQAAACPFCGAKLELERPTDPIEHAQEFVPFRVDARRARLAISDWLSRKRLFAPGDLKALARIDETKPVLWAAWVVSGHGRFHLTADEAGAGRKASWGPLVRSFEEDISGLLVPATRGLDVGEIASLGDWDLSSATATPPDDVLLEDFGVTRSVARSAIARALRQSGIARAMRDSRARLRNAKVEVMVSRLRTRRVLLPAWVAAYRYRDTLYRVVVHGQSSDHIVGKRPTSWLRVAAAVGLGLAAVALLVLLLR